MNSPWGAEWWEGDKKVEERTPLLPFRERKCPIKFLIYEQIKEYIKMGKVFLSLLFCHFSASIIQNFFNCK